MHEPATTLTDYLLFAECAWFAAAVARRARGGLLDHAFTGLFVAAAVASLAGGTVHGFYAEPSAVRDVLWALTLLSIGVTAAAMLVVALRVAGTAVANAGIVAGAAVAWSGYAAIVLLVSTSFVVAIAAYLPAALFLAGVLLARRELPGASAGLGGIALALAGAAGQQAELGFHPVHFDHNAVYHVVQMIALYGLYRCAVGLSGER